MTLEEIRQQEFLKFMEKSKLELVSAIDRKIKEITSDIYVDYAMHIESDAWINYREEMKQVLAGETYKTFSDPNISWAKDVRSKIFQENKEELIAALNQDLLDEVSQLKRVIKGRL